MISGKRMLTVERLILLFALVSVTAEALFLTDFVLVRQL